MFSLNSIWINRSFVICNNHSFNIFVKKKNNSKLIKEFTVKIQT